MPEIVPLNNDLRSLMRQYWSNPAKYATWISSNSNYTPFAILHGLQFQAVMHYNNCRAYPDKFPCTSTCIIYGKWSADEYTKNLSNGRHDLHPNDDNEVHRIAFEIHKELGHQPTGVMTMTYVDQTISTPCECYEKAYQRWIKGREAKTLLSMPVDPDDLFWMERFN